MYKYMKYICIYLSNVNNNNIKNKNKNKDNNNNNYNNNNNNNIIILILISIICIFFLTFIGLFKSLNRITEKHTNNNNSELVN